MKEKCCAIFGSPPESFPWGHDEEDEKCGAMKIRLFSRITFLRSKGITHFIVVLDSGVGLYAAEMINSLQEVDPDIQLTCIIPWEGQATKWTPELRERYFEEQEKCAEVVFISAAKTVDCEIKAVLRAIDMAAGIIAVYGEGDIATSAALHYAQQMNKENAY